MNGRPAVREALADSHQEACHLRMPGVHCKGSFRLRRIPFDEAEKRARANGHSLSGSTLRASALTVWADNRLGVTGGAQVPGDFG